MPPSFTVVHCRNGWLDTSEAVKVTSWKGPLAEVWVVSVEKRKLGREPDTLPSVMVTWPEAPVPTIATITESETIWKEAAWTPPKVTLFTLLRCWPSRVILAPVPPVRGVKEASTGGCGTTDGI